MITFDLLTFEGVKYVCERLHPTDRLECANQLPKDHNSSAMANLAIASAQTGVIVSLDGKPVTVLMGFEVHSSYWSVSMFSTQHKARAWRGTATAIKEIFVPAMVHRGLRSAGCWSMEPNRDAHRMLSWIGFSKKSDVIENMGALGADFSYWHCNLEDLRNVLWTTENGKH